MAQVTRFYQFREEVLEGQFSSVVAVVNNHAVLEYQRLAQLDNFIQVRVLDPPSPIATRALSVC